MRSWAAKRGLVFLGVMATSMLNAQTSNAADPYLPSCSYSGLSVTCRSHWGQVATMTPTLRRVVDAKRHRGVTLAYPDEVARAWQWGRTPRSVIAETTVWPDGTTRCASTRGRSATFHSDGTVDASLPWTSSGNLVVRRSADGLDVDAHPWRLRRTSAGVSVSRSTTPDVPVISSDAWSHVSVSFPSATQVHELRVSAQADAIELTVGARTIRFGTRAPAITVQEAGVAEPTFTTGTLSGSDVGGRDPISTLPRFEPARRAPRPRPVRPTCRKMTLREFSCFGAMGLANLELNGSSMKFEQETPNWFAWIAGFNSAGTRIFRGSRVANDSLGASIGTFRGAPKVDCGMSSDMKSNFDGFGTNSKLVLAGTSVTRTEPRVAITTGVLPFWVEPASGRLGTTVRSPSADDIAHDLDVKLSGSDVEVFGHASRYSLFPAMRYDSATNTVTTTSSDRTMVAKVDMATGHVVVKQGITVIFDG